MFKLKKLPKSITPTSMDALECAICQGFLFITARSIFNATGLTTDFIFFKKRPNNQNLYKKSISRPYI